MSLQAPTGAIATASLALTVALLKKLQAKGILTAEEVSSLAREAGTIITNDVEVKRVLNAYYPNAGLGPSRGE